MTKSKIIESLKRKAEKIHEDIIERKDPDPVFRNDEGKICERAIRGRSPVEFLPVEKRKELGMKDDDFKKETR